MSDSRWRNIATPIIAAVLSDLQGEPDRVIRKALREAYPFGPKQYHPYKIWCDEIKVQMGTKKAKSVVEQEHYIDPNQQGLFR